MEINGEEVSGCAKCYHAFGDTPNPHEDACTICIRNPKYPSMKLPEAKVIEGIRLSVPQDMYITKDRKTFEEKLLLQELKDIYKYGRKDKKGIIPTRPYIPFKPIDPVWEKRWEHVRTTYSNNTK